MQNLNFTTTQRFLIVTILTLVAIALLLAASNTAGFTFDQISR